ncbi:FAD dependent oxidoreductase [compost metagenome]
MTHEGQSAARVSGSCFVMGEAAGTAAAMALSAGVMPAELPIAALQAQLTRQGAFLGGQE